MKKNKKKASRSSMRPNEMDSPFMRPFVISRMKILLIGIFIFSFLGFLDAAYLTIIGITREVPPCSVTHGCETVLTSDFAYIGPIPIAAFGIGYFVLSMILSVLLLQNAQQKLLRILFFLNTAAFIAGIGLFYIQGAILHAFCQFCLGAELLITLIFLFSAVLFIKSKKNPSHK